MPLKMPRYAFLSNILLFLAVAFLPSCTVRKTDRILRDVDTYIQSQPDSALRIIRTIDPDLISSRKTRAHYALLLAMALDKNWIDTTDLNVVMPAVTYYDRHGSDDQRMKAWYYLGRIHENAGEMENAIVALTLAEEASTDASDVQFKGLLHFGTSYIYKKFHEIDRAIAYTAKGMAYFREARDTVLYNRSIGHLATLYQEKAEWDRADSLYTEGMRILVQDTASMVSLLKKYASMKVVQPDPDPQGAVDLLKRCRNEYHTPLSLKDYSIYAYASALLGDDKTCDEILAMIRQQPEEARRATRFMEYKIAKYRSDHALALELYTQTFSDQTKQVRELLNHSVDRSLSDYYAARTSAAHDRVRIQQLSWTIVFLLLVFAGGIATFVFFRLRNKERKETERLMQLAEESRLLLQSENIGLESRILALQHQYSQLFKEQFAIIGELGKTYFRTKQTWDTIRKEEIFRKVEEVISGISENDERHAEFETMINQYLDDIIAHLKADLGPMSRQDERFLCYMVVGFDAGTIASILGLSLSNVYTKKSRLKDRIYQLDSPYSDQYKLVI